MRGIGPHIVTAVLVRPDRHELDDDLRALRRSAAEAKASSGGRRRFRLPWRESSPVTSSTLRRDDASTTTA